ncbi:MAG: P-II family nitrogen regulator [Methanobacteriaceae archaeon]|jgi:nitrogen regulatory protein P-II 1|nr:P-II family nitrogen regulator [Methanobacteriaceae archaeon]
MKRVVAIIRQEKLEDVKNALHEIGCDGMNVSEVKGRGRQMGIKETYRGSKYCIDLLPKTRIELVIKKEDLDLVTETIVNSGKTGEIGDGKIFISPIEEIIRIRTGEKGKDAI